MYFKAIYKGNAIDANLILTDSAELHKLVVQQVVVIPYPAIIKFIAVQDDDGTQALAILTDEELLLNRLVIELG